MPEGEIVKVGVVGCGLMGSGIVEVLAMSGAQVVFTEGTDELVARGRSTVEASLQKAVARKKIDASEAEAALARISGTASLDALSDSDLIIEAATEDMAAKLDIFRKLGASTPERTILASNTSSIPIIELAVASGRPDRVIGMHFFNPPPVMKLLELIPALTTSSETLESVRAYGSNVLGKTCVVARDEAGFIVNRLLIPYLNDAIRLLESGVATRDDIDSSVTLGLAHPMGPLTLADLIGLDTTASIGEVLFAEFREARYTPPPLLKRMVAAGKLGRKTGSGFYDYPVR